MEGHRTDQALLCRVQTRWCALPLAHVIEVMRPLPIEPAPKAPHFVRGLSIIRGAPVPVLDLARLFDSETAKPTRWVTVRTNDRQIAIAVDAVAGIRFIPADSLQRLPPLLQAAAEDIVSTVATLDDQLLLVLGDARLIPASVWEAIDGEVKPS